MSDPTLKNTGFENVFGNTYGGKSVKSIILRAIQIKNCGRDKIMTMTATGLKILKRKPSHPEPLLQENISFQKSKKP